jgi:hypothetical protein
MHRFRTGQFEGPATGGCPCSEPAHHPAVRVGRITSAHPASPGAPSSFCDATASTALAGEPELMVISNADGDIRHPAVVEVMDELRLAGMARLASAVRAERRVHP